MRLSELVPLEWWKLTDKISPGEICDRSVVGRCSQHVLGRWWLCCPRVLLAFRLRVSVKSLHVTKCINKILVCSFVYNTSLLQSEIGIAFSIFSPLWWAFCCLLKKQLDISSSWSSPFQCYSGISSWCRTLRLPKILPDFWLCWILKLCIFPHRLCSSILFLTFLCF